MKASELFDNDDALRMHVSDPKRCPCAICAKVGQCSETRFSFGWANAGEAHLCPQCAKNIMRLVHHPVMVKFLPIFLTGLAKYVEFSVNYDRANHLLESNREEWEETLQRLCMILFARSDTDAHQTVLTDALAKFTGLPHLDAYGLVSQVYKSELTAARDRCGRQLAEKLVREAGAAVQEKKINIIKSVRDASGLGLVESKNIVDDVIARQQPGPAVNGKSHDPVCNGTPMNGTAK